MRVHIIQEYVPTYRVGFFAGLSEGLAQEGHTLVVRAGKASRDQAARRDGVEGHPWQAPLRQCSMRLLGRRVTFRRLGSSCGDSRPDVMVIELARRNVDAYRVFLPRRWWPAKRIIFWGHGRDYTKQSTRLEQWLLAKLAGRASHVWVYTEGGRAALPMVPDSQLTVLRNSVDTRALESHLEVVRVDGVRPVPGHFIYIGGLDASKSVPLLLHAFDVVLQRCPHAKLTIAGDGRLADLVRNYASSRAAVKYVGRVDGRSKAELLASGQVFINPGRVGLVAVECLYAGLPLITCASARHAPEIEYLEECRGVTMVSDCSPEGLAEAMCASIEEGGDAVVSAKMISHSGTVTLEGMIGNALQSLLPSDSF